MFRSHSGAEEKEPLDIRAGAKALGVILLGAAGIVFAFWLLLRPPTSKFACPEFYGVRFGLSHQAVAREVARAGGPEPTGYDLYYAATEDRSDLSFSVEGYQLVGFPVHGAYCDFFSDQGTLSRISIIWDWSESTWDSLCNYYTQQYGLPTEETRPSGDALIWRRSDARITLFSTPNGRDDPYISAWYEWTDA